MWLDVALVLYYRAWNGLKRTEKFLQDMQSSYFSQDLLSAAMTKGAGHHLFPHHSAH